MIKKLLWLILPLVDDNWGYTTPIQKRFKVGDKCFITYRPDTRIGDFPLATPVTIVEFGRHDYLVKNNQGKMQIVYQFEIGKRR